MAMALTTLIQFLLPIPVFVALVRGRTADHPRARAALRVGLRILLFVGLALVGAAALYVATLERLPP